MIVDTMSYAVLSFLSGVVIGALGKAAAIFLKNNGYQIQSAIYHFMGRKRVRVTEKSIM